MFPSIESDLPLVRSIFPSALKRKPTVFDSVEKTQVSAIFWPCRRGLDIHENSLMGCVAFPVLTYAACKPDSAKVFMRLSFLSTSCRF